jgi:hypothetical protein
MLTLEQMTTNRINDRLNVLKYCLITMNGLRLNVCKAVVESGIKDKHYRCCCRYKEERSYKELIQHIDCFSGYILEQIITLHDLRNENDEDEESGKSKKDEKK